MTFMTAIVFATAMNVKLFLRIRWNLPRGVNVVYDSLGWQKSKSRGYGGLLDGATKRQPDSVENHVPTPKWPTSLVIAVLKPLP